MSQKQVEAYLDSYLKFLPPRTRPKAKSFLKNLLSTPQLTIKNNAVYRKNKLCGHLAPVLVSLVLPKMYQATEKNQDFFRELVPRGRKRNPKGKKKVRENKAATVARVRNIGPRGVKMR